MYSFKLCLASSIGSPEMRRVPGSAIEVSTYAKFVELCQSIYPKVMTQSRKKVLVKYFDNEKDEVIADSEESFQGIHVYCKTMIQCNIQFCLKLEIDNAPDSPVDDDDHFVKVENPVTAEEENKKTGDQVDAAAPAPQFVDCARLAELIGAMDVAIAKSDAAAVKGESVSIPADATVKEESVSIPAEATSKEESVPTTAGATVKEESVHTTASATVASAATRCRTCDTVTSNTCAACRTAYFCSSLCTRSHKTHTASECRDNCVKYWKESGVVFPVERPLAIGTLVKHKWRFCDSSICNGFIAGFDAAKRLYSVKFDDGYFADFVKPDDIVSCEPVEKQEAVCRDCGVPTSKKCIACKRVYVCPSSCILRNLTHTVSECRDNCIKRWKESGVVKVFPFPLELPIGTLVQHKWNICQSVSSKGFVADFDPAGTFYSIKFNDGYFLDFVKANDVVLLAQESSTELRKQEASAAIKDEIRETTVASAATKEEIKETIVASAAICQNCRGFTEKKCAACKTAYFCSTSCTLRDVTHAASECRDNCVKHWKESGVVFPLPPPLPIGTWVKHKWFRLSEGFIAGFNPDTKLYSVKYKDGYFSTAVNAHELELLLEVANQSNPLTATLRQLEAVTSPTSATVASAAIKEEIKQKPLASAAIKEEIKEATVASAAVCQNCRVLTDKKCAACKTAYFCSTGCTQLHTTHTTSECRDNCIKYAKESGVLPIGTLVKHNGRNFAAGFSNGFIADFDPARKDYSVKYKDGYFSDGVKPCELEPLFEPKSPATKTSTELVLPKQEATIASPAGATVASAAICRFCRVPTDKKCEACKTTYFCSISCTKNDIVSFTGYICSINQHRIAF